MVRGGNLAGRREDMIEEGGEQRAASTLEGESQPSWDPKFCFMCLAVSWAPVSVSGDGGVEVGAGLRAEIKLPTALHSSWLHPTSLQLHGWTFPPVSERRHLVALGVPSWLPAVLPPQAGLGDSAGGGKGLRAVFALAGAQT